MKDVSATEAARRFSEVLDSVEFQHQTFRVMRAGRPVARIAPVEAVNGRDLVAFLQANSPDPALWEDIKAVRAVLRPTDDSWPD